MMITGHMKGLATQWFMTQMKIHGVNVGEIWESRKAFWMDLKVRFGDSDPNFLARTRLQKLKQGDKSVHYYNSQFNEHVGLTGYNETTLVNQYFSGLDSRILEGIFTRDYVPKDLKGTQSAAIQVKNLREAWLVHFQIEMERILEVGPPLPIKGSQNQNQAQMPLHPLHQLIQLQDQELLAPWTSTEQGRKVCAGIVENSTCLGTCAP